MEDLVVIKGPNNSLHPATEEDAARIARYKLGQGINVKTTALAAHNLLFHKKMIMLFKLCFDFFSEQVDAGLQYKGQVVKPSFDLFRKELTILSGHYEAHHSLNGTLRVEAKSISFKNRSDEEKEKIFSDVINAALRHVYRSALPEQELRNRVDQLMAFDS